MSNPKITQALSNLFDKQRIVFWYDTRLEFRADFETLELPDVEKVELANNEFGVKYRLLREQPEQKFLIYREGTEPSHLHNWLLDVQLASGNCFRTDQVALWLAELELGPDCYPLLEAHVAFFESAKRREALSKLLEPGDSQNLLQRKMLAVCAGNEPRLDVILESLLGDLAAGKDVRIKLIESSGLNTYLWEQVKRAYGYSSEQPGLHDFVIELFKACFMLGIDPAYKARLSAEALVFLKRWKDSRSHEQSFETLSEQCAAVLQIDDKLQTLDWRSLLELDYFELIDRKILSELVRAVVASTVTAVEVEQWVRQRRQSHWFERFKDVYLALEHAAQFIQVLDITQLQMESLTDGVKKYASQWFRLDQRYRKFVYHLRESGQASLLGELAMQVENLYGNNYLSRLNDRWQQHVDAAQQWEAAPVVLQRNFFSRYVQPFVERRTKVCVLISDAFRYEVGEELQSLIRQEDRFEADLEPMLSMLPSYTQLGMAALLPNSSLQLADNDSGDAIVDGQSAQGSVNRGKILATRVPASQVVRAKDLLAMNQADSRALLRDNEVVYVYHNLIDKTGDTRDTEERVFAAAEETLSELIRLVKKLTNANASNLLITADHGFIYQNHPLQESDFLSGEPEGDEVLYRDRRFVLGRSLREGASFKTFNPVQLGLTGTLMVQIPKSINRLRLKGSGSRFVHGGATLQEVVIPVIRINKKRQSDVGRVGVEFIGVGGKTITTGQLAVVLYQTEAVTEKLQSRRLRAGLFTLDGELVSDQHELLFDFSSANPRERELPVRFILSRKADEANNQQVELLLEETVEGTSHFTRYKAARYSIRRSFSSEFDF
ncbi:MAG TPA: BREX-1 system phosphatase PglZ type A [Pseudomonas sp.]|uniref:BREX-1 system phosphatase PglZ type A n=1 Tax=Pseudomonas haemolytica TaxID=2600065 RepID=A0ABS1H128_9PSED|nr:MULTISPECIES: BREX-1 system phosphatase PglZ type A [Pseudomonas]MBJ2249539.1 BREX-1 system phosphatase PglZ type A [Pseudomonas haemolytica]MBJ2286421.1 BREX-1 system phosphatase PglZ type A [Pseudomonas sp. MF6755]MBK3462933.1 BREX-1 system phosphatase PglZ type A [Pseudomonas haemolytica]MBX9407952.1 BREX-1 system phosphatase PglZ type A [Pseudomonas baetica]MDI3202535.1 BREX-1 system phosphatase PglZ type A [Pseudomonas shahriarae]